MKLDGVADDAGLLGAVLAGLVPCPARAAMMAATAEAFRPGTPPMAMADLDMTWRKDFQAGGAVTVRRLKRPGDRRSYPIHRRDLTTSALSRIAWDQNAPSRIHPSAHRSPKISLERNR